MPEIAVRLHCRAASLYIHAGLIDKADIYTNRASALVPQLENEQLKLVHRHVQASLLDRKNRFEDAASKYYALSRAAADMAPLTNALTCAILAPAGPRRSRMLAILYNDERARRLELFSLLERLHMGRILRQEQIDRFRPTLKKHQLVRLADGDTVLDRAVMEHNLLAVSRLYANIGFVELGTLLCVDKRKAETIAARMIYEGRMKATVDQVDGVLRFGGQAEKIERWDSHIASLCMAVDDCVDAIVDKFPQFATHLES